MCCMLPIDTLRCLAGDFLDKVFDGAVSQYLVRALEVHQPSAGELDELEAMITKARQQATEPSHEEPKDG